MACVCGLVSHERAKFPPTLSPIAVATSVSRSLAMVSSSCHLEPSSESECEDVVGGSAAPSHRRMAPSARGVASAASGAPASRPRGSRTKDDEDDEGMCYLCCDPAGGCTAPYRGKPMHKAFHLAVRSFLRLVARDSATLRARPTQSSSILRRGELAYSR